jgi:hypothetical protein
MLHDPLPAQIRSLFWDLDPRELRWERDQEQIIGRVLASGSWDAVTWLRKRAGDDAVREWIERHQGRGLSPRQLRFWELILDLPHRRVDEWLRSERRQVWDRRTRR